MSLSLSALSPRGASAILLILALVGIQPAGANPITVNGTAKSGLQIINVLQERLSFEAALDVIRTAWLDADGNLYAALVHRENLAMHRMTRTQCARHEGWLVAEGALAGFDGLSPVLLGLHDCAADGLDFEAFVRSRANMTVLGNTLWYQELPELAMYGPIARWNGLTSEAVRSDALRATVSSLTSLDPLLAALMGLDELLWLTDLQATLCRLPYLDDTSGDLAVGDALRLASCRSAGHPDPRLTLGSVCAAITQAADPALGAQPGLPIRGTDRVTRPGPLDGLPALDGTAIDMLAGICSGSGHSLPGTNMGGLSGFGSEVCLEEGGGSFAPEDLSALIEACVGPKVGGGNPLAAGAPGPWADPYDGKTPGPWVDPLIRRRDMLHEALVIGIVGHNMSDNGGISKSLWLTQAITAEVREVNAVFALEADAAGLGQQADDAEKIADNAGKVADEAAKALLDCTANCEDEQHAADTTSKAEVDAKVKAGKARDAADAKAAEAKAARATVEKKATDGLPGDFDPNDPDCQELTNLTGIGGRRGVFDEIYERQDGRDPRTEMPSPDAPVENDGTWSCYGRNPHSASHCRSAVLCELGQDLDPDTCQCTTANEGMPSSDWVCFDTNCAADEYPVPISPSQCACMGSDSEIPSGGPDLPF